MQKRKSLGLALLRAIIESGSRTFIHNLRPGLFLRKERPAFRFFVSYYRENGRLPTNLIMQENGFHLPPAGDSPADALERVVNRGVVNIGWSYFRKLQRALASHDGSELRHLVEMRSAVNQFYNAQDVLLLPDAIELAMQASADMRASGCALPGTTLGWAGLDEVTGGVMPGQLVAWIAPPTLAASHLLAKSLLAAQAQDRKVLLVSMEMDVIETARRLFGLTSEINPDLIERSTLSICGKEFVCETIRPSRAAAPIVLVFGNLSKSVDIIDALIKMYTPDVAYIDAQYLMWPTRRSGNMKKFEFLDAVGTDILQIALARNIPIHLSVQDNHGHGYFHLGAPSKVGYSDTVEQISSIAIHITEGQPPYESITRNLNIVKNREGSLETILINFLFNPIDFSQMVPSESGMSNIDWMA
jgi:hypothetical protein